MFDLICHLVYYPIIVPPQYVILSPLQLCTKTLLIAVQVKCGRKLSISKKSRLQMMHQFILVVMFVTTFNLLSLTQEILSKEVISFARSCSLSCHTQLRYKQIQDLPCCTMSEETLAVTKSKPLGKGTYGTVYGAHSYYDKVKFYFYNNFSFYT